MRGVDQERQVVIRRELAEEGAMTGAVELLERLHVQGIALAVVSSSSHHWVDGWLEKLDLARYFQHVVCRGDARAPGRRGGCRWSTSPEPSVCRPT